MITYSELLETIQTITNIVMLCYVIFEPKNESFIIRSIEASTRLKSRDSRTCKQVHLKSNSSFTIAGGPLQV